MLNLIKVCIRSSLTFFLMPHIRIRPRPQHANHSRLQLMARRDYVSALDAYSQAITCSPDGPQSHVYYSNRAAALCYLERYHDAVRDSEKSLELSPTYGKAHARLGLSRFFLHDYAGAVEAYTAALEYDPDNVASKSYLAKAKTRLEGRGSRSSSRNASPAHRRAPSGLSTH